MIKKYIAIAFLIIIIPLLLPYSVEGQSASPDLSLSPSSTPTNTQQNKLDKIEILKEKVATKVAEIRSSQKKGLYGQVQNVTKDKITFILDNGDSVDIAFNEDTAFYSLDSNNNRSNSSLDKVKEQSYLTVFGYFDNDNKTIDAKYIYITPPLPAHLIGKISEIDRTNYTLTIKTQSEDQWTIDIETYTKTQNYSNGNLVKSGFSKLSVDNFVFITTSLNPKEKNRASAIRILVISEAAPTITSTPTPSPTPQKGPTPTK